MAQIIRSGAFLQQCWSVHPLCLSVKRPADGHTLVLTCSSCRSSHHLSFGLVVPHASPIQGESGDVPGGAGEPGETLLNRCIAAHQSAVTLREMDVFQDLVLLRCADCRRQYEVTVASFETHSR
jgi:hypothetical protein